jgi:hypothetical protein
MTEQIEPSSKKVRGRSKSTLALIGNKRRLSVDEVRIRHLNKLARHRYGDGNGDYVLPDDQGGHMLAAAIITHQRFKPAQWLVNFCNERAPWLDPDEIDRKELRPMRADALGKALNLTAEARASLGLYSIGACDQSRRERTVLQRAKKRERDRERQRRKRLMAGQQSRANYLALALSRTRPWEQEGISRRTWERKRVASPSPCNTLSTGDTPASSVNPASWPVAHQLGYLLRLSEYRRLKSGKLVKAVPGLAACSELRRAA